MCWKEVTGKSMYFEGEKKLDHSLFVYLYLKIINK